MSCNWLIIEKDSSALWEDDNKIGKFIKIDGSVADIDNVEALKDINQPWMIAINWSQYNRADEGQKTKLHRYLKQLFTSAPEYIWVHFGGINSPNAKVDDIAHNWLNPEKKKKHHVLQGVFPYPNTLPLPYSQNSSEPWDKVLKELTGKIKNEETVGIDCWDKKLKEAQDKALKHFDSSGKNNSEKGKEALIKALQQKDPQIAMKALFPVFIYFDGLAYVENHPPKNSDQLLSDIRAEVPELLKTGEECRNDDIKNMAKELSQSLENKSEDKDIISAGKTFCEEYRKLAKEYFSSNS